MQILTSIVRLLRFIIGVLTKSMTAPSYIIMYHVQMTNVMRAVHRVQHITFCFQDSAPVSKVDPLEF